MAETIDVVTTSLYSESPSATLFHYTSFDALLSIVPSGHLWATDVHYLNDSSELEHAVSILNGAVREERQSTPHNKAMLDQLSVWLNERLANGYMLFVVCFTENGDLLSQWRGYTPHARGVSIGFLPGHLIACAQTQGFQFGHCIYELAEQQRVARRAIRAVARLAIGRGPAPPDEADSSQSYYPAFREAEDHLLRICALVKHGAFTAEREWRAVSPCLTDYVNTEVLYRSGKTTLLPYRQFRLKAAKSGHIGLEQAVLGPTPNPTLGMQALSNFLAHHGAFVGLGHTRLSRVPYRET